MLKYINYEIAFREFPDEVSLCINISGCKFHCPGCHSPELWEDIGTELTFGEVLKLISKNEGITCIGLMGGNPKEINEIAKAINHTYKIGWYWGGTSIPKEIELELFDYIKIGPYIKELGGLDNPNTNQKMYQIGPNCALNDITYKFQENGRN